MGSGNPPNPANPGETEEHTRLVAQHLRLFFRSGEVFEIRAPKCADKAGSAFKSTVSGYYTFESIDKAAADIAALDARGLAPGVYVTLSPVAPALLARAVNQLKAKTTSTTSDVDVPRRHRFLIDCDPVRPAETSSTDAELGLAAAKAGQVRAYLTAAGWPEPAQFLSGNGHHLIYAIDLPGDDGGVVERVLSSLAARFSDAQVKIDTGVGNAARITKVVGTMARKGDDLRGVPGIEDRPHRRATFVRMPESLQPVPADLLEKEATLALKPAARSVPARPQTRKRSRKSKFEEFPSTAAGVRNYLRSHGIEVAGERRKDGATILDMVSCPVTGVEASGTEISVLVEDTGTISYRNLHDRGQGLTWFDVRDKLEPGFLTYIEKKRKRTSAAASGNTTPQQDGGDDEGGEGGDEQESDSQRDRIVRLAKDRYRFGRSLGDEPFAVPKAGPNIARMLRGSKSLRSELASVYYQLEGKAPSSGALADALLVLEGEAQQAEPEPVCLRIARHGETIVLDLGDNQGRAVVIDAGRWAVAEVSPVLFKRNALTAALPVPVGGGSLDLLRVLLNVTESAWPLTLAWMIAALVPDIEHPILLIGGQQDAGKSTTAKFIACLIDPSNAILRTAPRNVQDWAVAAMGSWIVPIDNVSQIPEWLSDACCRAVTGDGMVRRALYTDDGLAVMMFQRCLIFTSIDPGALKGDLGRRLLKLDLEPLTGSKKKRPPRDLRLQYERERPAILGALLDLLVRVLAAMPSVELTEFFALADFERVLAAMDRVRGTRSLSQYKGQWEKIAADVVDGDMVAQAVRAFCERKCRLTEWSGTATQLLVLITPEQKPKDWPENGRELGGQLRRLVPVLKAVGVEVLPPEENDHTRRYTVRFTAHTAPPPESGPGEVETADLESGGVAGGALGGEGHDRPSDESGGQVRGENVHRPSDRPAENHRSDAGKADSRRSGGQGGDSPPPSTSPDERDADDENGETEWTR